MTTLSLTLVSDSAASTHQIGQTFGEKLTGGVCVCLVGPLGAGKTEFVKGACTGLGVTDEVISPTFILYEAFEARLPVVHIDLYRLEHESELDELGVFDLVGTETILLAEWGNRSQQLMADAGITVTITPDAHHNEKRTIVFEFVPAFQEILGTANTW